MKFRTAYDRERMSCPCGSRFRKKYVRKYSEGVSSLVEDGIEDVYDSIQKAGQGLLLEDLIRRSESGDTTAIRAPIDSYPDLTNAPTSLLDAHNKLADARSKYDALPLALRQKFGNDFSSFLKASADGSLLKILQPNKVVTKPSVPAVKPLTADEISKIRNTIGGNNNA